MGAPPVDWTMTTSSLDRALAAAVIWLGLLLAGCAGPGTAGPGPCGVDRCAAMSCPAGTHCQVASGCAAVCVQDPLQSR